MPEVADAFRPLRRQLCGSSRRGDAAIASSRHRRHHRLPHRSARRTAVVLQSLRHPAARLPLLPQPRLPEVSHAEQTQAWLEQRREEMLPVPYFHVTVTVPEELRAALRRYQIDGYGALMPPTQRGSRANTMIA